MKVFYASAITYPSLPVSRIQTLFTAQALADALGDNFVFGAARVDPANEIYSGQLHNFGKHKSIILGLLQMWYIYRHDIDVVFARDWILLWVIMKLNQFVFRRKLRFIFESHHIPDDWRLRPVLTGVEHIFCVSEGLAHDIAAKFKVQSISVQRNGVALDKYRVTKDAATLRAQFDLPATARIVTYIGSIGTHDWKGEDVFLDARDLVTEANVHFVIAGVRDQDYERITATYAAQHTTILGRLSQQEVSELESLSDVLVLPNKPTNAEGERYTSPIKMFSYMRSGTPIVASGIPSIKEVLNTDNACLVEPGQVPALAAGISTTLRESAAAQARAAQASNDVAQYTWQKKGETIVKYLTTKTAI